MESGVRQLTEQDLSTLSTTKQVEYGAVGMTADGRVFRYAAFGGTSTIAPGQLLVAPAVTAGWQALAIPAAGTGDQTAASLKAGSTFLTLTNGATAITADKFAEGYAQVNQTSGTNEGPIVYQLRGNQAAAGSGSPSFDIFFQQAEPLRNAETLVAATDTVNLVVNGYNGAIASATAGRPVGVTVIQVPNTSTVTNYGWVQTKGMSFLTNDAGGNLTVGEAVSQSTSTAGDVVAAGATTFRVGLALKAFNSSTAGPVWLSID